MVTGTSSVTIRVGSTGRALNKPLLESPLDLPNPSPSPISFSQQSPPVFSSLAFLSSAYNQEPSEYSQSSRESSDADIERASKNVIKGPRDSVGKVGSIKFAKKSRKPPASDGVGSYRPENSVAKLSSPIPKPRKHTPDVENNVGVAKESVDLITSHPRSRVELKLDLKPVYDNGSLMPKNMAKYQPIPDLVSMTHQEGKLSSVNDNSTKNGSNKPTFRINKLISQHSPTQSQLKMNNHVFRDKHSNRKQISETQSPQTSHCTSDPAGASNKVENMNSFDISRFPAQVSLKPVPYTQASKSQPSGMGNPVHMELISKFTNSSLRVKNVPRLRKVKTREPKTVKELFSDYKFTLDENDCRRNQEVNISSSSKENVSGEEGVPPSEKNADPQSKKKLAPMPPMVPDTKSRKVFLPIAANEPPSRIKKTNAISESFRKNDGNLPAGNCFTGRIKNPNCGLVSHHESLRVPWRGINDGSVDGNAFKRGVEARKSYTKVVCVVNL